MSKSCPICGQFMNKTDKKKGGTLWECSRCEYRNDRSHVEERWGIATGAGRYR